MLILPEEKYSGCRYDSMFGSFISEQQNILQMGGISLCSLSLYLLGRSQALT